MLWVTYQTPFHDLSDAKLSNLTRRGCGRGGEAVVPWAVKRLSEMFESPVPFGEGWADVRIGNSLDANHFVSSSFLVRASSANILSSFTQRGTRTHGAHCI